MRHILSFLTPALLVAGQIVTLGLCLTVGLIAGRLHFTSGIQRPLRQPDTRSSRGHRTWRWFTDGEHRISVIIYAIAAVAFLLGASWLRHAGWRGSLAPELISTAVAISLIDWLVNYRSDQREKRRVINQMGATDSNDVALAALAVARAERWVKDGTLIGAELRGANLRRAELGGAHLQGAQLNGARLQHAQLYGAKLQKAVLITAYLQHADLRFARLQGANLMDAHLQWANLQLARLQNANLEYAKYNKATRWPKGFNPVAAGCTLVDEYDNPI